MKKNRDKKVLIRITTVPVSFNLLLRNQLKFMSQSFDVIAISSDEMGLQELAEREGVSIYPVNMTREITPIKDIGALIKLWYYFLKTKPDIVHTHTPKAGLLGMMAAALAGVPMRIHTVAGLPLLKATGLKKRVMEFTERLTSKCAHLVIANSKVMKGIMIQNNYSPASKITTLLNGSSNGVDTEHYHPDVVAEKERLALLKQLQIEQTDKVFTFIGRIVADKGINELVEAFVQFSAQHQQVKLVLVGWLEEHLNPLNANTLHQIKHHPSIINAGYQNDIRPYLSISHAVFLPSHREGFPNVPMQAGAMGIPSVVTDINGCNEIVVNNENGIIIPVNNKEAIFAAMGKMFLDDYFFEKVKSNTRKMIVSRFEQTKLWNEVLFLYQKLLQQNS